MIFTVVAAGCASPRVANTLAAKSGFRVVENQPYQRGLGLEMDVYYPAEASGAPVVVFFYGGRWRQTEGDKSNFRFVGQALASRGFVVMVPNLRAYPAVRFPLFVNDAAQAVRWARDNARAYGGNADQMFVMGHDSGAHIAALLALDPEYLKAAGADRDQLRGMIGLAGAYDFMPITAPDLRDLFGPVDRFRYSQPVFYVDGNNPPLLLMHGRNDETIPVSNTESLAKRVAQNGGAVETVLYDSLSHAMILNSLASYLRGRADVLDNIEEFIKRMATQPRQKRREQIEIQATPLVQSSQPLPTTDDGFFAPQAIQQQAVGSDVERPGGDGASAVIELPPIEMNP